MSIPLNKRYITLPILFLAALFIGVGVGSVYIPPGRILQILLNFGNTAAIPESQIAIVKAIRIPRVLIALLTGGSLAISGASIQSLLGNPLASPYILGVSSGASLGVAFVTVLNISLPFLAGLFMPIVGFFSSLISVASVIFLASRIDKNYKNNTIILVGIVTSLFINGLLTLLIALSGEDMKGIIFWQMGALGLKGYKHILGILPFVALGLSGLILLNRELDALSFGEEAALNVGIETKRIKLQIIILSSILTGSAIAVTGIIGFVGLVSPYIVRRLYGNRHIVVLPVSFMFGGIFLVFADLIARTIVAPAELPVGSITALIGAPFFTFVFFLKRGGKNA